MTFIASSVSISIDENLSNRLIRLSLTFLCPFRYIHSVLIKIFFTERSSSFLSKLLVATMTIHLIAAQPKGFLCLHLFYSAAPARILGKNHCI